jgi:hypothetical protein
MLTHVQLSPGQSNCILNGESWKNGTYIISLWNNSREIDSGNLIITH